MDIRTIHANGGSVIVESRVPGPGRGYRLHWAGARSSNNAASDCGVSADLLLTLATLDPAIGADHLATWASNAVVVVSSGESSAERIHSVGEMIRLAGMRLESVVLLGADKSDKSLGLTPRPDEQVGMGVLGR